MLIFTCYRLTYSDTNMMFFWMSLCSLSSIQLTHLTKEWIFQKLKIFCLLHFDHLMWTYSSNKNIILSNYLESEYLIFVFSQLPNVCVFLRWWCFTDRQKNNTHKDQLFLFQIGKKTLWQEDRKKKKKKKKKNNNKKKVNIWTTFDDKKEANIP